MPLGTQRAAWNGLQSRHIDTVQLQPGEYVIRSVRTLKCSSQTNPVQKCGEAEELKELLKLEFGLRALQDSGRPHLMETATLHGCVLRPQRGEPSP